MKISINDNTKAENSNNIKLQKSDTEILQNNNVSFSQLLQNTINGGIQKTDELPDIDFAYDLSMDFNDALFFVNLVQDGQFIVQQNQNGDLQNLIKTEINQNIVTQKTIEVSNQLTLLIEKAQKTNKPVRISFDNNTSVILKIDKSGKINAEFIPGSIEAENYLMNNITSLRQKFNEQNLPYTNLSYRQRNRNRNNKGDR